MKYIILVPINPIPLKLWNIYFYKIFFIRKEIKILIINFCQGTNFFGGELHTIFFLLIKVGPGQFGGVMGFLLTVAFIVYIRLG